MRGVSRSNVGGAMAKQSLDSALDSSLPSRSFQKPRVQTESNHAVIKSFSYVGFTSPNFEEWVDFGPNVLGAELAGRGPDGSVQLRVDDKIRRINVHPGDANDLAYLGWDTENASGLNVAVAKVEAAGILVHCDPELGATRSVAEVAWFLDPFGFRHELSYGLQDGTTFMPGRAISGFVTGNGGLGHTVILVPDLEAAETFYQDVLGFKMSDKIEAGMSLRFFHCNSRHHTIAMAGVPGAVGMHHLMLELKSIDDVGSGLDIVNQRKIPLAMSLGRHTNDLMTSFYVRTPSGFEVEYGTGGKLVDDRDWEVGFYDAQSIWGHKPPAERLMPGIVRPFVPAVRAS